MPAVIDRLDELRAGTATFGDVATPPMTIDADTPISDVVDAFQKAIHCSTDCVPVISLYFPRQPEHSHPRGHEVRL
ncbi:MAG: hypothetical protein ACOCSF_04275 [Halanaeroarchaeum sp.]